MEENELIENFTGKKLSIKDFFMSICISPLLISSIKVKAFVGIPQIEYTLIINTNIIECIYFVNENNIKNFIKI